MIQNRMPHKDNLNVIYVNLKNNNLHFNWNVYHFRIYKLCLNWKKNPNLNNQVYFRTETKKLWLKSSLWSWLKISYSMLAINMSLSMLVEQYTCMCHVLWTCYVTLISQTLIHDTIWWMLYMYVCMYVCRVGNGVGIRLRTLDNIFLI